MFFYPGGLRKKCLKSSLTLLIISDLDDMMMTFSSAEKSISPRMEFKSMFDKSMINEAFRSLVLYADIGGDK